MNCEVNVPGSPTFQISQGVVCRQTHNGLRMLFDRRKGVMYELNESASAVVAHLAERPATTTELSMALAAEFDAPATEIRDDIEHLLADFQDAGFVEQSPQS